MHRRDRLRTGWHQHVGLCVGICALLLCMVGAHLLGESKTRSRHSASSARADAQWTSQRAHFSLLRSGPEGLPQAIRRRMRWPTEGANWDLAQKLPGIRFGQFWLLPGRRVLCLVSRTGKTADASISQICTPTSSALRHGVASVTLRARPTRVPGRRNRFIVGVAPDHASLVMVHTGTMAVTASVNAGGVFHLSDRTFNPPDLLTYR